MTDHNNLSGAVRFSACARKAGIKPIMGVEVTLDNGTHLTLIAENRKGYANLCRILTHAYMNGGRKSPKVSLEILKENHAGLIGLSGCMNGEIPSLLFRGKFEEAKKKAVSYSRMFGKRNFYLEIQNTFFPGESSIDREMRALGGDTGIRVVGTNNVHYAAKPEFAVQEVLTCIRTLTTLDEPHPERKINAENYLKSSRQMESLLREFPGAMENTLEIAERCEDYKLSGTRYNPRFDTFRGYTSPDLLKELTYKGARHRYKRLTRKVRERLEYELSIIEKLGFADYFLMVWDLVKFAKSRGIRHSGRGSAADSAVAYCLSITSVDSVTRNLSFERFINPERSSNLPDIDVDFDARYRDDITRYIEEKYGRDRVGGVCTFSRYRARGAIRDVGKVLGFPNTDIDRFAKLMPWVDADEIGKAVSRVPELVQSHIPRKKFERLLRLCASIADHPRHIGTHLGGVVVTGEPIISLSPLQPSAKGGVIIQFDKDDVEDLRLLKLDLLCLRTLSAVEDSVGFINSQRGEEIDFDTISLDDELTYDMLGRGETIGVFQLESPAQKSLQQRLHPDNIEDVVASVALIRPGPIAADMVTPFLRRRLDKEEVTYIHPELEHILKKTYGVVLFQEQVIEIACRIGGFSPGEADALRRTMTHHRSKKEMEEIGKLFIRKAVGRGVSKEIADRVFSYIKGYAGYGFCEAHAAAFGDTAYKTAYLVRHHPVEFYAALLNNQPMGFYPPRTLVNEARKREIRVLLPDVNLSQGEYSVQDGAIRVGLKQVKGISARVLNGIARAQPFSSIRDFCDRVQSPKDIIENLVLCGGLDLLHGNRKALVWWLYQQMGERHREKPLFIPITHCESMPQVGDYSDYEKFRFECEVLGFSPGTHVMEFFRDSLRSRGVITAGDVRKCTKKQRVKAAGVVIRPHRPPTRSGKKVVFLSLEDETGMVDVTIFESVYKAYGKTIFTSPLLIVEGRIDNRGTGSVIAERVYSLRERRKGPDNVG